MTQLTVDNINIPNFGSVERPKPLLKGRYLFNCTRIQTDGLKPTKNGDAQWALYFKCIEDGPANGCDKPAGKTVVSYHNLSATGLEYLKALLEDLGVDCTQDDIPVGEGVGKSITLSIGLKTYEGKTSNTVLAHEPVE